MGGREGESGGQIRCHEEQYHTRTHAKADGTVVGECGYAGKVARERSDAVRGGWKGRLQRQGAAKGWMDGWSRDEEVTVAWVSTLATKRLKTDRSSLNTHTRARAQSQHLHDQVLGSSPPCNATVPVSPGKPPGTPARAPGAGFCQSSGRATIWVGQEETEEGVGIRKRRREVPSQ